MPDELPKLLVWVIQTESIESLALYDREDTECGVAELIGHYENADGTANQRWLLEFRARGQTFTNQVKSFDEALAWLVGKRNAFLPGGYIRAVADFQINEQ